MEAWIYSKASDSWEREVFFNMSNIKSYTASCTWEKGGYVYEFGMVNMDTGTFIFKFPV